MKVPLETANSGDDVMGWDIMTDYALCTTHLIPFFFFLKGSTRACYRQALATDWFTTSWLILD